MREIKFRAWDKDNFEMFTYDQIGDVVFGLEHDGTVSLFICDSEETPNVDVMQYTGLKDRANVEIYEGDILEDESGHVCEVVYLDCQAAFMVVNRAFGAEDWMGLVDQGVSATEWAKVIGNTHESPELLGAK